MTTDWGQWKFWFDVGQWGIMLMLSGWMFIDKGRAKNSNAIREMTMSQQTLDKRITQLENKAATHEDIAKLTAEMEGLKSTLTRLTVTTDRIHDYLLNKKEF
ncbi:hypothetical protein MSP8887_02642 [Marinomonas spartinae]|uniref:hypothetical protein n=1 Tax=Marinomonas spartinae TaxID=1792290 RepID=UPI000808AE54|nr:hypothetical protein [Marinomonas spartinae]NVK28800.1 hypothetical protein [Flavobacteriia bacterium]SBS36591.1 hypothetical protein MSP8887_02642 [Marinomonas spartinae]